MFLGGMLVLELLLAAVWFYRRAFFPAVLLAFLFAGSALPVGGGWVVARWVFLGTGAFVGCFIMLNERRYQLGLFHALAFFSVLAALVSAAVSRYPSLAVLKAVSLLLLFVYASTGVRLAVLGREKQFLAGLVTGFEIFVAALFVLYYLGVEVMGNPNSLGAVMAVTAPILLWGMLLDGRVLVRRRRLVLYALSIILAFQSHSRAGMVAVFISSALLCLGLRKYKMMGQGIVVLLILVAVYALFEPEKYAQAKTDLTADVVYKGKDPGMGILQSRQSPWQGAVDAIKLHPWFGSGFGTTENGKDASADLSAFETGEKASRENGSSYLTIATWVGAVGVVPFVLLLLVLLAKTLRTLFWMANTGDPSHPAVPLAMVVLAGLIHAAFEDWLFAPGYYLCVFFWSMAFVLADLAPRAPFPSLSRAWRPKLMRPGVRGVVPTR
jgi:O-antigen ligase